MFIIQWIGPGQKNYLKSFSEGSLIWVDRKNAKKFSSKQEAELYIIDPKFHTRAWTDKEVVTIFIHSLNMIV